MESIVREIRDLELFRFITLYCEEYNNRNFIGDSKDGGKSSIQVTADEKTKDAIIIGIQGGIVSDIY